ncbi:hypothetical protein LVD13_09480 [Flavobacteriaceae bacterium D16]|nr:hypothetical protein [Flavobacteriaceae bacterium D16]
MVTNTEPRKKNTSNSLRQRVWQGALLGLGLATVFFVFFGIAAGEWIIMPMVTVTLSGAIGGVFFFIFDQLGPAKGWPKVFFRILGFLFYTGILWLSLVLAYSITGHWD